MQNNVSAFDVRRLGVVMRPEPGRSDEIEGVLNPAAARGPDGELYLFPRLVGEGNYSRIGLARVLFDRAGDPFGVERLGYALEPQEPYELRPGDGTGGCEDARVTFLPSLGIYVMAYAAWGPTGPRLAAAISSDCLSWERLGLIVFEADQELAVDFNAYHNKDGAYGPEIFIAPNGRRCIGLLHRPLYTRPEDAPAGVRKAVPSIWVSYCEEEAVRNDVHALHARSRSSDRHRPRTSLGTLADRGWNSTNPHAARYDGGLSRRLRIAGQRPGRKERCQLRGGRRLL